MNLVFPLSRKPVNRKTGTSLTLLNTEQLLDSLLVYLRADDAHTAGDGSAAAADVRLAGNVVEIDPLSVGRIYKALGTQDRAVACILVELAQRLSDLLLGELLRSLHTPGGEHLVCVVVMMVMSAAAGAAFAVLVLVIVVMVVIW